MTLMRGVEFKHARSSGHAFSPIGVFVRRHRSKRGVILAESHEVLIETLARRARTEHYAQ